MPSLEQQLAKIAGDYEDRLKKVRARATMDVVETASLPKVSGGNMPVDTGKLKNSVRGMVNGTPTSATDSPAAAVARAGVGDTIFIGWTARYAWAQEIRSGFMRLAVTRWREFAEAAARSVSR